MTIKVGSKIPETNLNVLSDKGIDKVCTRDLFQNKTIVLFAVPGAFTPVCSAKHLPGFIANSDKIKEQGVDEIVCIAVNDPFVMSAWAKEMDANGSVIVLSDGNGEFTKSTGLEMNATPYGMGIRSERYAMIVKDGIVQYLAVEKPGEFSVSSADSIIDYLQHNTI